MIDVKDNMYVLLSSKQLDKIKKQTRSLFIIHVKDNESKYSVFPRVSIAHCSLFG